MTQKSASRLARDAEKKRVENYHKTNTVWDDLNGLNNQIRTQLAKLIAVVDAGRDKRLMAFVVDKQKLAEQITLLTKDLGGYLEELNKLSSEHAGKTGGARDPDSYFQAINLYHRYELLTVHIQQIIGGTATEITAAFLEATNLMNVFDAQQALKKQTEQVTDLPVNNETMPVTEPEPVTIENK